MLNIQNFRDFFSELKQHAAEAPITEWVMAVGISDFGLLMTKVQPRQGLALSFSNFPTDPLSAMIR